MQHNRDRVRFSFFQLRQFVFPSVCVSVAIPLDTLVAVVLAVFQLPVHDVADHRRGDQAQELEHAEDGRVDAH